MTALVLPLTYLSSFVFPLVVMASGVITLYSLVGFIKDIYADVRSSEATGDRK